MDKPRFERVKEIITWMATHTNNTQVGDGHHRAELTEAKDFIGKAQEELTGWVSDKAFVPPLGLTKTQVSALNNSLKMKGTSVRSALAGQVD
jgi:hypothetical protein